MWDAIKGRDVAGVVIEPMMGAAGFIPAEPAFVAGLEAICRETGTLLIFDEVVTGFRLGPGGAQELFGVRPDISVIGKIMGGGFPIGALCGRWEVFERFDHRRFPRPQDRAAHGGTFSANPVSMAAGIATLEALRDGDGRRLIPARSRRGTLPPLCWQREMRMLECQQARHA